MFKKMIFFIIMTLIVNRFIYCDTSSDNNATENSQSQDHPLMKFRGSIYLGFAYYPGVHDGIAFQHYSPVNYEELDYRGSTLHNTDKIGRLIGQSSGSVELELYTNYSFIIPFVPINHFLFNDDFFSFTIYGNISPVTLQGGMSIELCPLAFLKLQTGFLIGSGWNFAGLFNGQGYYDLGLKTNENLTTFAFPGPVMEYWISLILQFDAAAIMPSSLERWTHIIAYAESKFRYDAFLNIGNDVPYQWKADRGQNLNGWNFLTTFILGYQLPVIEDDTGEDKAFIKRINKNFKITTGMFATIDVLRLSHYADSPMNSPGGWGSDFCFVEFGPVLSFDLPCNLFLQLFFFWKNDRQYTSSTVANQDFRQRDYEDWYVYFRRVAVTFGWNF